MTRERLFMRKIKEVLRLRWEAGRSQREIALSCRLGRTTVQRLIWCGLRRRGCAVLGSVSRGGLPPRRCSLPMLRMGFVPETSPAPRPLGEGISPQNPRTEPAPGGSRLLHADPALLPRADLL